MKSKILVVGALLSCSYALADSSPMPNICNTAINFGAHALTMRFSDSTFGNPNDPNSLLLNKDPNKYQIRSIKDLGDCEQNSPLLKQGYCNIAGGPAEVYQADILANGEVDGTVTVTYNRGSCSVDAVSVDSDSE